MATEKQIQTLQKFGYTGDIPEDVKEASTLIGNLIEEKNKSKFGGEKGTYTKKTFTPKKPVKRVIESKDSAIGALKQAAFEAAKEEYPEEDESGTVFSIAYGQWKNILGPKYI